MQHQFTTSVKLAMIVASALLSFGFISWIIIASQTAQLAENRVKDKSEVTLNQLSELIRAPLMTNDIVGVQFALRNATKDLAIQSASLFDVENVLITQSAQPQLSKEVLETFKYDIFVDHSLAGTLKISMDSQPIRNLYSQVFILWGIFWLVFSIATTYMAYITAEGLTRRLRTLTSRLPGTHEPMADEMLALENRIQPLLSSTRESDSSSGEGHYCSVVTAKIQNRPNLDRQLNHENLERVLENIDLCIDRTIELYGGRRLEGSNDSFSFYIRSTEHSKQHILVCLMAVYSLQQLLERLSSKLGIELAINWTLCNGHVPSLPIFRYHERIYSLKQESLGLSATLERGLIAVSIVEYDIEQLRSIAKFSKLTENHYLFEGFSEQRQMLLEKQIVHLASVCL